MAWIYPLQRWWLLLLCGLLSIAEGELSISLPIKQREIIAFQATTYYFTVHCIDLLPPTPLSLSVDLPWCSIGCCCGPLGVSSFLGIQICLPYTITKHWWSPLIQ